MIAGIAARLQQCTTVWCPLRDGANSGNLNLEEPTHACYTARESHYGQAGTPGGRSGTTEGK